MIQPTLTKTVEHNRVGLLMALLNSKYQSHISPYIITGQPHPVTVLANEQPAAEQTICSSVEMVEGEW